MIGLEEPPLYIPQHIDNSHRLQRRTKFTKERNANKARVVLAISSRDLAVVQGVSQWRLPIAALAVAVITEQLLCDPGKAAFGHGFDQRAHALLALFERASTGSLLLLHFRLSNQVLSPLRTLNGWSQCECSGGLFDAAFSDRHRLRQWFFDAQGMLCHKVSERSIDLGLRQRDSVRSCDDDISRRIHRESKNHDGAEWASATSFDTPETQLRGDHVVPQAFTRHRQRVGRLADFDRIPVPGQVRALH